VNIRVTPEVHDILEACRFLESQRGLQEVLEPVVNAFAAARFNQDSRVRTIVEAKAQPPLRSSGRAHGHHPEKTPGE
jgi:hypothetical protein